MNSIQVTLTNREMEVLNTCISVEIMKQHFHYGEGASNERLDTLYRLRDKLITSAYDESLPAVSEGVWYAQFPKGASGLGTITVGGKTYNAYIGNMSGHVSDGNIKHKLTVIEV